MVLPACEDAAENVGDSGRPIAAVPSPREERLLVGGPADCAVEGEGDAVVQALERIVRSRRQSHRDAQEVGLSCGCGRQGRQSDVLSDHGTLRENRSALHGRARRTAGERSRSGSGPCNRAAVNLQLQAVVRVSGEEVGGPRGGRQGDPGQVERAAVDQLERTFHGVTGDDFGGLDAERSGVGTGKGYRGRVDGGGGRGAGGEATVGAHASHAGCCGEECGGGKDLAGRGLEAETHEISVSWSRPWRAERSSCIRQPPG